MAELTDAWVRRAREGSVEAFEALYHAHQPRVHALSLRLLCDAQAAEELTQDVFVKAWQGLPAFEGRSSLATWLHGIAVRTALHYRRRARRDGRVRPVGDALDSYAAAAAAAFPGTRIDLERGLARLPPRARAVLVLHCIEGHPQDEVASLLGIATGTVKAQLHRARRLLKEAMAR